MRSTSDPGEAACAEVRSVEGAAEVCPGPQRGKGSDMRPRFACKKQVYCHCRGACLCLATAFRVSGGTQNAPLVSSFTAPRVPERSPPVADSKQRRLISGGGNDPRLRWPLSSLVNCMNYTYKLVSEKYMAMKTVYSQRWKVCTF